MIEVENDFELVINEQPFHPHIYENQLELLQIITIDLQVIYTNSTRSKRNQHINQN